MTQANSPKPTYKAGLTKWSMPFDSQAGARAPQVPDDPGPIHAVRPAARELGLHEPYVIEDTGDYRAAICGAKVKVIMPNSFKAEEEGACAACIKEARNPRRRVTLRPGGGPVFGVDLWGRGRWFGKR